MQSRAAMTSAAAGDWNAGCRGGRHWARRQDQDPVQSMTLPRAKLLDLILKTVSAYSCKGVGGSADVTSRSWCSPAAGWRSTTWRVGMRRPDGGGSIASTGRGGWDKARVLVSRFGGSAYCKAYGPYCATVRQRARPSASCSSWPVPPGRLPGTTGCLRMASRRFSGTNAGRTPTVVRCYAVLRWLGVCMPRRVPCRSSQIASPERYGVS